MALIYANKIDMTGVAGCFPKHVCEEKIRVINEEIKVLEEEKAVNKQIIKAKVKGQIRMAQRRNNEIRERIQSLRLNKQVWYNGGVW